MQNLHRHYQEPPERLLDLYDSCLVLFWWYYCTSTVLLPTWGPALPLTPSDCGDTERTNKRCRVLLIKTSQCLFSVFFYKQQFPFSEGCLFARMPLDLLLVSYVARCLVDDLSGWSRWAWWTWSSCTISTRFTLKPQHNTHGTHTRTQAELKNNNQIEKNILETTAL